MRNNVMFEYTESSIIIRIEGILSKSFCTGQSWTGLNNDKAACAEVEIIMGRREG